MFEKRKHVLRCSAGSGARRPGTGASPRTIAQPSIAHFPNTIAGRAAWRGRPLRARIPIDGVRRAASMGRSSVRINEPRTADDPMSSVARRSDRGRIARVRKRNFTAHAARTRPRRRHTPWRCKTERIRAPTLMRTVPVDGTGQSEAMSGEVCMDRPRAPGTVGAQGPTYRQGNGRHCGYDLRSLRRSRHTGSGGGPPSGRTPP